MNYPGSTPPRSLDLLSRLIILFGGFHAQFGWTFFIMGSFFFWLFFFASGAGSSLRSLWWENTTGEVVRVEAAPPNDTYGGDQLTIRYTVAGEVYEEIEYASRGQYEQGNQVPVTYSPSEPTNMRLDRPRENPFGFAPLVSAIFPLVGLGFIYYGMRNNLKSLELLINGYLTTGRFIAKAPTNATINKIPVYRYTFAFEDQGGKTHEVSGETHLHHLLAGEEAEGILYAPSDPSYGQLYDLIPYAPKMAPDGILDSVPFYWAVVLIQPTIGIGAYGWVLFGRFF